MRVPECWMLNRHYESMPSVLWSGPFDYLRNRLINLPTDNWREPPLPLGEGTGIWRGDRTPIPSHMSNRERSARIEAENRAAEVESKDPGVMV